MPSNLQEVLIRLCEERATESLGFLFINAPELLKIKNEKNQMLAEVIEAQKNLAAKETLGLFRFETPD
ncbi:MAG: hypothetical protein UV79_C0011G0015 [candidate division TM6 bacterium GW2011_GWF2_43_17]|nr:MAG: hypothetical protein UV79_C0011G0015 [candidate division TM6 bacterium GW2011_GWF2_43_17]